MDFGKKCELKRNNILGRYVVAKENIKTGEILLVEKPALVLPQWDSNLCCCNCFRDCVTICKGCKLFPLCMNCSKHDKFDCEFFQKIINENDAIIPKTFLIDNFNVYGVLKFLLLMENPETKDLSGKIIEMESHLKERRDTIIWEEHKKCIINPILKCSKLLDFFSIFKKEEISENKLTEVLQRICGIFDVNSYEIRGPEEEPLRGIYPNTAMVAHNCIGNTMITVDQNYTLKLIARRPINQGEIIYYNYTNPLLGTEERRKHLKIGKYFECTCDRCEDPTELGSFMSALKCGNCENGSIVKKTTSKKKIISGNNGNNNNINEEESEDDEWKCTSCECIKHDLEVRDIISTAKNEIDGARNDIRQLEMLISKLSKSLHPNHYILIDLKQNVAAILRQICMNTLHKPGKPVLMRKLQLCKEILPVLNIVEPGISRLRSIGLYEYYSPLVELSHRQYEENNISKQQYLDKLLEGESILKESVSMLLYEPTKTPEGYLTKKALEELKELRSRIEQIRKELELESSSGKE